MQAYQNNNKEKGLFTFYREQAEIEEKLSLQKKYIKQQQNQNNESNNNQTKNRALSPKNNLVNNQEEGSNCNKKMEEGQKNSRHEKRNGQYNKKLLQILQKHKYGRNKKNMKVIVKAGKEDDISLKYHLQALMVQDESNDELKQSVFVGKKSEIVKVSPFQKVALCPTNFQSELQQIVKIDRNKKVLYSHQPILPYASSQEVKKVDKIKKEVLQIQMKYVNQHIQSNALPKIGLPRAGLNRQIFSVNDKEKLDSYTSRVYKPHVDPLAKISNDKNRPNGKSMCIESARCDLQNNKIRNSYQNKIYPIFIQNKDSRKSEADIQQNKQKLYVEVIRRLKFT